MNQPQRAPQPGNDADLKARRSIKLAPLVVTIIWGVNTVLIKYLVIGYPALAIQTVRMLLASLILIPLVVREGWQPMSKPTWYLACMAGVCSVFIHQVFMAYGMVLGNAGLNSLILSLNPLATALLAHFFLSEKLNMRRSVGVLVGFCGVLFAVGNKWLNTHGVGLGELLMFGAMLAYVVGSLFVKRAKGKVPALQLTAVIQASGALILLLPTGWELTHYKAPLPPFNLFYWVLVVLSAFIGSGLCNYYWNRSIQELGATYTSLYLNVMPFVSLLTAAVLLAEPILPAQVAGLAAVAAGIYFGTQPGHKRDVTPADPHTAST